MEAIILDPKLMDKFASKTVIVTGAAGGIGSEMVKVFASHSANVVVADLPHAKDAAEKLINSLPNPSKGTFVPVNILNWEQMKSLYKSAIKEFGSIEVVVANAGVMESQQVLDPARVDENGDPVEPREAFKVIDTNVKGTLNSV